MPEGEPATELPWLEPYPDAALEGVPDAAPGPDARYEMREAVQLAFIAAIQHLPPRQRAVLLLRDVLGWSAAETGQLLDASVASVNSALQRAHATLEKRSPAGPPAARALPDDRQRALLERYVRTWENADLDGFVALLREDAVFSMPPRREWYSGRAAISSFFGWAWKWYGGFRLVPTAANRQPALALYSRSQKTLEWRPHSLHVLTLQGDAIAALTMFQASEVFAAFGLPDVPPDDASITPASSQQ
jgi:RNA polymerase sigma-70 factor (ECF subfamily)